LPSLPERSLVEIHRAVGQKEQNRAEVPLMPIGRRGFVTPPPEAEE
jgi:hypothetical protein